MLLNNNNGLMPKYLLCWLGRQGVREKKFTAKGVCSSKSLGTPGLEGSLGFLLMPCLLCQP